MAACTVTRPTVKIGLVAPFEGAYRSLGYDVIWAVRLAVREANTGQSIPGYGLELVALDDMGDADRAREQAAKLAADPLVVAVLGHWRSDTTAAAAPDYATAGLPLLATGGVAPDPAMARYGLWGQADCLLRDAGGCIEWLGDGETRSVCSLAPLSPDSTDAGFSERYRALSGGVEPTFASVAAYDATRALIAAIARADAPTRAGVSTALARVTLDGLAGPWTLSDTGVRPSTGPWGYRRQPDGAWQLDPAVCAATP